MIRFIMSAALLLALAGCSGDNTSTGADGATIRPVAVTDAVCRPTPNGRQVTACYLNLVAGSDNRLVSIDSPAAALVQVHETAIESGMAMMRPVGGGLDLPAGQTVSLSPGGHHIMLSGVREPLATGDSVELTLAFETGPEIVVTAPVGQPTAANAAPAAG